MTSLPADLDIARSCRLDPIETVAARLGLSAEHLEPYGRDVAKISLEAVDTRPPRARYVVITAVTPTPLGEGKTTTAVGLAQGLARLGHLPVVTLRQPSLGPTFGIKGGAAGSGYSQVLPMERLNLHLTGDFHAVTAAHNLLSAVIDNHIFQGNQLGIEPHSVTWPRVVDINDRALRNVIVGLGDRTDGNPRQSRFDITAASEVMVILSLARDLADLRARLGRIVIGFDMDGRPVTAEDLDAAGAMAVMLIDAIKPNLLQTSENTPVLVHAGPFGNIATGNSSVIADRLALGRADYVLTEAGFGADMGAERFCNVKCRTAGLHPDAAVLVTTVRAMKTHSGRFTVTPGKALPHDMLVESPDAVQAGLANLVAHIRIVQSFGVQPVVAINAFPGDYPSEHAAIRAAAEAAGASVAVATHVADGGAGATELAELVVQACAQPGEFRFTYDLSAPLADKIAAVATTVYGADGIEIVPAARRQLARYQTLGFGELPVVIAKTHLSISHDPGRRGAPSGWTLPVREVRLAAGAGYVYAICGSIRTMPGLGSHPALQRIDIDPAGQIVGLS